MSDPRQQAREVLDRLQAQLLARLPSPPDRYIYGQNATAEKLELTELAAVAGAARDYLAAEAAWHSIPVEIAPPEVVPEGVTG